MKKNKFRNFLWKIRKLLGYIFLIPLWKALYNRHLIKKYPFLEFKNSRYEYFDMNDNPKKSFFERYGSTWNDILEVGWRKRFGKDLWRDLLAAMLKDGIDPKTVAIHQCKEKYGTLRLYLNTETDSMSDVISHYEDMSMLYCINCGRPTKYISGGWILYLCDRCAKGKTTTRLTTRYIPYREIWNKDQKIRIDSDVNFKKYWPEPTEEDLKNEFL